MTMTSWKKEVKNETCVCGKKGEFRFRKEGHADNFSWHIECLKCQIVFPSALTMEGAVKRLRGVVNGYCNK